MSEFIREQRPLLCDDISDEELRPLHVCPQHQARIRAIKYRGRSKYNVKGAAAIIRHWPAYLSSSVTYWWIGLGMIIITIFMVYNSIVTFAMLPPTYIKATKPQVVENKINKISNRELLPNVFMHLLVDYNEEVDLNKFLPFIEVTANKYADFKYNLVVVLNNTYKEFSLNNAEENNDIALNSLLNKNNYSTQKSYGNNIVVEYVTLSKYLDDSPLKKDWRQLPHHYIEFLIRAVSVWDKGGIAFNPTILTPKSPHPIYIEKLQALLEINKNKTKDLKKKEKQSKKKLNNIRDIIDALENEENSNDSVENLIEAENKDISLVTHNGRKLFSNMISTTENETKLQDISIIKENKIKFIDKQHHRKEDFKVKMKNDKSESNNVSYNITHQQEEITNTEKSNLLPIFLEYLFHNEPKNDLSNRNGTGTTTFVKSSVIEGTKPNKCVNSSINSTVLRRRITDEYKPMIISTESTRGKIDEIKANDIILKSKENVDLLTIDLKGNIIATKTACHAFIGTVFSNAIHHTDTETLTEFIISELSIFCKGILSSCKGIDLILL